MAHSYIAYIDESGDEGLNGNFREPGIAGGASHWLTLGATVWRLSRDLDAVQWAKGIIAKLPAQRANKPLHFMDLNHAQKLMAVQSLSGKPFRSIAVIANKTVIPPDTYKERNQLYQYLCRYLIERISWLCRDMRPQVPEGDGRVKIVFSRKRTMNYTDFQAYLTLLRNMDDPSIKIHWPVIDIDGIEAHDHGARFGLQIADVVTSGLTAALEPDFYGNVEPRYARLLKQQVYCRNKNYMSYGTKMFPPADQLQLSDQQREFVTIFGD